MPGLARGHVVGQRSERGLAVALPLLPQRGEPHPLGAPRFVGVDDDVVALGVGREEPVDGVGRQPLLGDDLPQQLLGVVEQLAGSRAELGVVEDPGVLSLELPRQEERGPVDERDDLLEWNRAERSGAQERGDGDRRLVPVDAEPALDGLGVGDELALHALAEGVALALLRGAVLGVELGAGVGPAQAIDDADALARRP